MTSNSLGQRRATPLIALLAALMMLTAGCGTDDNSDGSKAAAPADCTTGAITGAGSTFVQNIAQQWIKDYGSNCTGATINYNGVGSSAGVQQLNSGTIDFAGTDVALSSNETEAAKSKYGEVLTIPWSAGGIAVEYNLAGIEGLKLSPATLAGIFAGTIRTWNDPALKADNPGIDLPGKAIQVVHRSDGSGTTAAFTAYMAAVAPSVWTAGTSKDVRWPTGQGAKGSDGVTAAVKSTDGAIGYAEVSFAQANSLGMAQIKNEAGEFVAPSGAAVTTALQSARVGSDGKVVVDYKSPERAAYPISTVTYVVTPKNFTDPAKAKLVRSFIGYALSGGQANSEKLFYAPLADNISTQAKAIVGTITP